MATFDFQERLIEFQQQERERQKNEQLLKDSLTQLLGAFAGAKVVPSSQYEEELKKNEALIAEAKEKNERLYRLLNQNCKLQGFRNYHSKWKPLTRGMEKRKKELRKYNLDQIPEHLSDTLRKNFSDALRCYVMDLKVPCYMMILRSIELAISELYDKGNPRTIDPKTGQPIFIAAKKKLDWAEQNGIINGMDYKVAKAAIESRNNAVHDFIEPTELQLYATIEMILKLLEKLK